MGLPRNYGKTQQRKTLSQSVVERRDNNLFTLSQPVPGTSANTFSPDRIKNTEEENELVNRVIRYLFVLDREKQAVSRNRIIKNALDNNGKHFSCIMIKVESLLSKIFGYRLMEMEGNKYMLLNEIQNKLPHIRPCTKEAASQQVLLFIVLVHIFMHEESCTEESLWNFLATLGISCLDDSYHNYFGDVKHLITEVFINQKYLDKTIRDKNNTSTVEFKWGPRAEHEFSRRMALNFVSQVYNGRPINKWPLQYNALIAHETSSRSIEIQ